MGSMPTIILALVAALALGAGSAWKLTADAKDDHYAAIMESQRANAEVALRTAQGKALDIERKHNELARDLEVAHEDSRTEKDRILADNRRLARELGGLRDPGKRPACRAAVPATAGPTVAAADDPADGRLSDEASGFLLDFARECDRAADYAGTAHRWVRGLKAP